MSKKYFKGKITAQGAEITVLSAGTADDFISLTDIARYKNPEFPADVIKNWLRTKFTIDFLGTWEHLNNPRFKLVEFNQFKSEAGANTFVLSPQKWIEQLLVLANLENVNALFIGKGLPQKERIKELNHLARSQMATLMDVSNVGALKAMDS